MRKTAFKPAKKTDAQAIVQLIKELRERDNDPAFANAPVIDAYARISKNPESGEMEKTDRQLVDILHRIKAGHYRLGLVLRDDNISAWKKDTVRPGWELLLIRIKEGKVSGVVCWHTDRLMRQSWDLEQLVRLGDDGQLVISCFGEYSLQSSDDRFHLRILTAAAQKASDDASRRQLRKAQARRDAGLVQNGNRAMGHAGTMIVNKSTGERAPVPDSILKRERAALRKGVTARIAGASIADIVDMWNRAGVRTPAGNLWTTSSVQSTFRLARHAGLAEYNGVINGPAENVEPIITPAEYHDLQALRTGRKTPIGSRIRYTLSGVVKCAACSHPMVIASNGDKRQYRCPSPYSRSRACGKTLIAQIAAEQHVKAMVLERLSDPEHADSIARKSEELIRVESELAMWNETLAGIVAERAERQGTRDPMLPAEYGKLRESPLAHIERLNAERDALVTTGARDGERVIDNAKLSLVWDKATTDERQSLIRNAFPYGIEILPRPAGARPGPGSTRAADRIRECEPETVVTSDAA